MALAAFVEVCEASAKGNVRLCFTEASACCDSQVEAWVKVLAAGPMKAARLSDETPQIDAVDRQ